MTPASPHWRDTSRGGEGRPGFFRDIESWARNVIPFPPFNGRDEGWFNRPDNAGSSLPDSDELNFHDPINTDKEQRNHD